VGLQGWDTDSGLHPEGKEKQRRDVNRAAPGPTCFHIRLCVGGKEEGRCRGDGVEGGVVAASRRMTGLEAVTCGRTEARTSGDSGGPAA